MNCSVEIHEALKEDYVICPFCSERIRDYLVSRELCCESNELVVINGIHVCIRCGQVDGYELVGEYINFYEDMYRINRKSVYHRDYHIENVLNTLFIKHKIEISCKNRQKIMLIFTLINKVLPEVNENRKRLIKIHYILAKILKILKVLCDNIPLPKSKKTLRFYKQWWNQVYELIKDDINKIIQS